MIRKKRLVKERQLHLVWQHFLGQEYEVQVGAYFTEYGKEGVIQVRDNFGSLDDGILFVEYTNKETGEKSILLENEWFIQIENSIRHVTQYILENLTLYFDENLNLRENARLKTQMIQEANEKTNDEISEIEKPTE